MTCSLINSQQIKEIEGLEFIPTVEYGNSQRGVSASEGGHHKAEKTKQTYKRDKRIFSSGQISNLVHS